MQGDSMWLTIVGLAIIISIVGLLIAKKISPVVGMTLIPCIGALILGYSVADLVKFFDKGLAQVMNVVIMFIFAIIFFGIMNDSGLFKPLVKRLLLMTRGNVVVVCIMTALLGTIAQLDCTTRWRRCGNVFIMYSCLITIIQSIKYESLFTHFIISAQCSSDEYGALGWSNGACRNRIKS